MTDEPGLPLPGYRPQSPENLALLTEGKLLEERMLRYIDKIVSFGTTDPSFGASGRAYDARWLAIGRTHIQLGCMAVYRSVMAPGRATLPEDRPAVGGELPQPMRPADD